MKENIENGDIIWNRTLETRNVNLRLLILT
jgi:hypothetical protein